MRLDTGRRYQCRETHGVYRKWTSSTILDSIIALDGESGPRCPLITGISCEFLIRYIWRVQYLYILYVYIYIIHLRAAAQIRIYLRRSEGLSEQVAHHAECELLPPPHVDRPLVVLACVHADCHGR